MLVIRLKRIGKKNKPTYRVVVAEHSVAVNGSFVADLGFYNPHSKTLSIDKAEVTKWLNNGAKPSNTVARLLEKEKIKHRSVVVIKYHKAPKKKVEANPPASGKPDTTEVEVAPEKEVLGSTDAPADVIAPPEEATIVGGTTARLPRRSIPSCIEEAPVIEEPAPTEHNKSVESVGETAESSEQPAA